MENDQYREHLRASLKLQKDAAALSKKLDKTVLNQQPLQEGEIERLRLSSADGLSSRAGLQNLLLRVRIFLKATEGIAGEANDLQEKIAEIQGSLSKISAPQEEQEALQIRLSSLTVTSALLTQIQAQAQTIADSCRELESALLLAAKASGTTQTLRLQEAAVHARRLFRAQKDPGV